MPGHSAEMQPFANDDAGRRERMAMLGLGDGIAHILKAHLKAREEGEAAETAEAVEAEGRCMSGLNNRESGIQAGLSPTGAAPLPTLQDKGGDRRW